MMERKPKQWRTLMLLNGKYDHGNIYFSAILVKQTKFCNGIFWFAIDQM